MKVISIPVDQIRSTGRTRPVDPMAAEDLARDIAARGQRQPIEVAKSGKGWKLVSGGHRLAAIMSLGWAEIAAIEVKGKALELRRDEHLDNLARNELTMLERAVALSDLQTIYHALHPETREHVAGGKARQAKPDPAGAKIAPAGMMAFADAVIARTGRGKRTILQSAAIGKGLAEASVARLRGTDFEDHQSELEAISKQSHERQSTILDLLLAAENPARTVAEAIGILDGRTAADAEQKKLAAMVDRWGRVPKAVRRSFVMALEDDQLDELAEMMAQRGYHIARLGEAA